MPEQDQSNTSPNPGNVNFYPYTPIKLPLKELLRHFGNELGVDCVPLIITWGFKGPFWEKWSKLSWDELLTQDLCDSKGRIQVPAGRYLNLLCSGERNIGIRIGPAWGSLANFDIDVPDRRVIDALLHFCPALADTLWTKGSTESGHSIWFRMGADWPGWLYGQGTGIKVPGISGRPKKDKKTGELRENLNALEFRISNGIQSVIYGLHENKRDHYCVVNDKPILEFAWSDIKKLIEETIGLGWEGWPQAASGRTSRTEGRWTNNPLGWKGDLEERARLLEELGYEILDIEEGGRNRIKVRCPNAENHSTPEKEGEAVIFPGTDARGEVAFCCLHVTCKTKDEALGSSFNQRETQKLHQAIAAAETIYYRLGGDRIHETYTSAYRQMAQTGEFYNLNKSIVRWKNGWEEVTAMNSARIQPALNELGIRITHHLKGGNKIGPMRLAGMEADSLLDQPDYIRTHFPLIRFSTNFNFLWWNDLTKKSNWTCYGHNPDLECLVLSRETPQLWTAQQGWEFLDKCFLSFWKYDRPEDKSRALTMVLAIALCLGRWYQDLGALHLVVADRSQAGKTFLVRCIGALYGIDVICQEFQERAIDGVVDRFKQSLSRGETIFAVDNIRGQFNIPFFESLSTGSGKIDYRLPYGKPSSAEINRMILYFTGNEGFRFVSDFANRVNITKILYQPEQEWRTKEGEALLAFIRSKTLLYRSAIFGILAEYASRGAPRYQLNSKEKAACDFRYLDWTSVNNGILSMLDLPPLTVGLAERQQRVADPTIIWAEKAFEIMKTEGALDKLFNPGQWGRFLIARGLGLPFETTVKNLENIGNRSLATGIGIYLKKLKPSGQEGVSHFGGGYHQVVPLGDNQNMHLFSETNTRPSSPAIFEENETEAY